jgi:hypothetical protein
LAKRTARATSEFPALISSTSELVNKKEERQGGAKRECLTHNLLSFIIGGNTGKEVIKKTYEF